ncbi:MAG: enoyl-CoA hydratase/isomerase family protein [Chloroflexi bacterium]|nr:enoyl-CoA hydratase/isomerase family protein [Chloroflexota bacterium]
MDFSTILYGADNGVATLTMNRPEALNALTSLMRRELLAAVQEAGRDASVRAVILTGAGRAFCAGQDLKERAPAYEQGATPVLGSTLRDEYNPLVLAMRNLPKPIVGAVNGVAAGAGCSLALACDLRIASSSASFMQAFVKIGLVPDSGSSFFLPHLVGYARAAEMMFLGDGLPADRAEELGLVNRVVPAEELATAAQELAGRLAQLPTVAIGQTKRQLNRGLSGSLEDVLEEEERGQELASQTADHLEGVRAFLEKRPPRFTGK